MNGVLITKYFHPVSQNNFPSNVTKTQKLSEDSFICGSYPGVLSVKQEAQKNCKPKIILWLKKLLKLSIQSSASVCIPHD